MPPLVIGTPEGSNTGAAMHCPLVHTASLVRPVALSLLYNHDEATEGEALLAEFERLFSEVKGAHQHEGDNLVQE